MKIDVKGDTIRVDHLLDTRSRNPEKLRQPLHIEHEPSTGPEILNGRP
jgi:hypothetical protein